LSIVLPLSSMTASLRSFIVRVVPTLVVCVLVSCSEATAPPGRFPLLDDVGSSDWQTVSVGGDHSCGLKTNGDAYCWGSNRTFQLGVVRVDTVCGPEKGRYACNLAPVAVQPSVKFVSISAGSRHTCAIASTRDAYCWGANDQGQVGDFSPTSPRPFKIPG
jgi:alpha-tubulin suppressor-like RCC1 family protein